MNCRRHRADGARCGRAGRTQPLPTATIAPGVLARLGWGRGALLERVEMQPGAVYPEQTLGEELIIIGQEGSATIEFDGKTVELTKDQVLYLQPGAKRSIKAGREWVEGFRGVFAGASRPSRTRRTEHVRRERDVPGPSVTPSLQPGVVVNLNESMDAADDPLADKSYQRSAAQSQLIWGKNAQISLVRMDPGSEFPLHIHPEDQLTHTIRGIARSGRDGPDVSGSGERGT